jgi:diguanylate cyclase (GGDEF)-like protein
MTVEEPLDERSIQDQVEIELIDRLISPVRPLILYVLGFGLCIGVMWWRTEAPVFHALFFAATIASLARGAVLLAYLLRAETPALTLAGARRWESAHAACAIFCNLVLAAFSLVCFQTGQPAGYLLATCFALGQAASVATRNPRPWLANVLVTLALGPIVIVCVLSADDTLRAMAALVAFSLLSFYETSLNHARNLRELLLSRRRAALAANHDALTGLVNLRRFDEAASDLFDQRQPFALLYVDLDGFKPINDTYGHPSGDEVLRQVANRLRALAGPRDVVARVGGDEFAIVLEGEHGAGQVKLIADQIVMLLAQPVSLGSLTVRVGGSVGAVIHSGGQDRLCSLSELKRLADEALYASKREGKGRAQLAAPRLSRVG